MEVALHEDMCGLLQGSTPPLPSNQAPTSRQINVRFLGEAGLRIMPERFGKHPGEVDNALFVGVGAQVKVQALVFQQIPGPQNVP